MTLLRCILIILSAIAGWAIGGWFRIANELTVPIVAAPPGESVPPPSFSTPAWNPTSLPAKNTSAGAVPTAEEALTESNLRVLSLAGDSEETLQAFIEYSRRNPTRALDLALTLDGPGTEGLIFDLVDQMPPHLGTLAMDGWKRRLDRWKSSRIVIAVFRLCAVKNLERAWEEANQPGVPYKTQAMNGIAGACGTHCPEKGMELAQRISGSGDRVSFQRIVLYRWSERDVPGLLRWLKMKSGRELELLASYVPWGTLEFTREQDFLTMVETIPARVLEGSLPMAFNTYGQAEAQGWPLHRDWIFRVQDTEKRSALFAGAARALMKSDPQAAWNLLPEIQDKALCSSLASLMAGYQAAESPEKALAFADSLQDSATRKSALNSVLYTWMENDFASAAKFMLADGGKTYASMAYMLGSKWATLDPLGAATALLEVETSTSMRHQFGGYFESAMHTWVSDDSYTASTWVAGLPPGAGRDRAASALAHCAVSTDPAGAANWALSVSDPRRQLPTLQYCFTSWLETDRLSALHWLRQVSAPAHLKRVLEEIVVSKPVLPPLGHGTMTDFDGVITIY